MLWGTVSPPLVVDVIGVGTVVINRPTGWLVGAHISVGTVVAGGVAGGVLLA